MNNIALPALSPAKLTIIETVQQFGGNLPTLYGDIAKLPSSETFSITEVQRGEVPDEWVYATEFPRRLLKYQVPVLNEGEMPFEIGHFAKYPERYGMSRYGVLGVRGIISARLVADGEVMRENLAPTLAFNNWGSPLLIPSTVSFSFSNVKLAPFFHTYSVGHTWGDFIDITGLPRGDYFFSFSANPNGWNEHPPVVSVQKININGFDVRYVNTPSTVDGLPNRK